MNRETVEQLRAKLQLDLANALNQARQFEGAIAACDKLLADDAVVTANKRVKK